MPRLLISISGDGHSRHRGASLHRDERLAVSAGPLVSNAKRIGFTRNYALPSGATFNTRSCGKAHAGSNDALASYVQGARPEIDELKSCTHVR